MYWNVSTVVLTLIRIIDHDVVSSWLYILAIPLYLAAAMYIRLLILHNQSDTGICNVIYITVVATSTGDCLYSCMLLLDSYYIFLPGKLFKVKKNLENLSP